MSPKSPQTLRSSRLNILKSLSIGIDSLLPESGSFQFQDNRPRVKQVTNLLRWRRCTRTKQATCDPPPPRKRTIEIVGGDLHPCFCEALFVRFVRSAFVSCSALWRSVCSHHVVQVLQPGSSHFSRALMHARATSPNRPRSSRSMSHT